LLLAVVCAPALARAQETLRPDYDVEQTDWRGFSDLAALAQSVGYEVEAPQEIDWGDLGERDVLFLVYPTQPVDPAHVAAFIRRGGRVLIADDHGRADAALARLGIVRESGSGITRAKRYDGNPALPIAVAWDDGHPLAANASELHTNHPSIFRVAPGPDLVHGFGPDQTVVVAGTLGEGLFVALSDPSVLINGMLLFEGNASFAVNLLRFLRPPGLTEGETSRLVVLSKGFRLTGVPREPDAANKSLADVLADIDALLAEANDYLATKQTLDGVGWMVAGLVLLIGLLIVPLRRPREMDGGFARARDHEGHGFEPLVQHYDRPGSLVSFAYPMALLRERVDQRLAPLCGAADPLTALPPDELVRRVQGRAGLDTAQLVARVASRLRKLPPRAHAPSWPYVSRRDFERLHDEVQDLEKALGDPTRLTR
jgi:hypothetical protein